MAGLKALVTGGAGFIGSHLVDKLANLGCMVTILDDLSTGRLENIGDYLARESFEFFEGSVLDRKVVEKAVSGVDVVVHLAAVVSVPFSVLHPEETFEVNVDGTKTLLDQCLASGVKRFIFVSSCAVYGEPLYVPTDELHPVCPSSPYAQSKSEAERVCFMSRYGGLERVVLRLYNVYGDRQVQNGYAGVISLFAERLAQGKPLIIHGDGLQTRDFVHVSDVAEAIWLALHKPDVGGVFNVSSGKPVGIKQLAEMMSELAGAEYSALVFERSREGDIRCSQGDFSKAEAVLGYKPRIELRDGLGMLLEDFAERIVVDGVAVS